MILRIAPDQLLAGLRGIARGEPPDENTLFLLERMSLVSNGKLAKAGQSLYRLAWVLRKTAEANRSLGVAVRPLLPVQVVQQELAGYGAVPEEGVIELLGYHQALPSDVGLGEVRRFLRWANGVGLLHYSTRDKTIRVDPIDPDAATIGEDRRLAAIISPRTPLQNVARLRRVLRTLRGVVWWADPHFSARALEDLAEELDLSNVKEVRILSGHASNVITRRANADFQRFTEELANHGVPASWLVDRQRDWHDRWLFDDKGGYNMPPINTLYKGDYAEILPTNARPLLEAWFARSTSW